MHHLHSRPWKLAIAFPGARCTVSGVWVPPRLQVRRLITGAASGWEGFQGPPASLNLEGE
jgi:hypothetical protein